MHILHRNRSLRFIISDLYFQLVSVFKLKIWMKIYFLSYFKIFFYGSVVVWSTIHNASWSVFSVFQEYRACAERASILFFVLNDMSQIDPMYQFSLDAYISLLVLPIEKSPACQNFEDRIIGLNDYHTYSVYRYSENLILKYHYQNMNINCQRSSSESCVYVLKLYKGITVVSLGTGR